MVAPHRNTSRSIVDPPQAGLGLSARQSALNCRIDYLLAGRRSGQPIYKRALYCDPLTGLVAFPSFQSFLTEMLPVFAPNGVHLAIGDVDNLREFVIRHRHDDPQMFGHLAGNLCMRLTGEITLDWADDVLSGWPFGMCGTFGGDEVIIAASGRPFSEFGAGIRLLADRLRCSAPCPSSFALASSQPVESGTVDGIEGFRALVSAVDRGLFDQKEQLRTRSAGPNGHVVDLGLIDLLLPGNIFRDSKKERDRC